MAWSIPTYQGLYALGKPSAYRTAMFELCRALDERNIASGNATGYSWYKADGTTTTSITFADLEDIYALGSTSPGFRNMEFIQSRILSVVPTTASDPTGLLYYYETDLTTPWTRATLSTDVGASITDPPTKINEARWWQAMQDALDRIIVRKLSPGIQTSGARTTSTSGSIDDPIITDYDLLWTNRNDTPYGTSSTRVGWRSTTNPPLGAPARLIFMERDQPFETVSMSSYLGDVVKGEYVYTHAATNYSGSFQCSIGDATMTFSGSGSGTELTSDFATGSEASVVAVVDTSEPGSYPFSTGVFDTTGSVGMTITDAYAWVDFSTILTDQA